ncbi:putative beta-glucosidase C [Cytospora mali]|uniref:beta-glucosidase n=1 Tax=Cytospora mali TaxID=578113 RepID=A0A194UNP0_CYTMA|nr:putative beta-glucosidase C [Valsa mali var. pyri (nom. inval.)]
MTADSFNPGSPRMAPAGGMPTESRPAYEDSQLPIEDRVEDLISRMTLEEKAGQLFHNMIGPGPDGELAEANPIHGIIPTRKLLEELKMSHFNLIGPVTDQKLVARWHNKLQQYALDHTRLGIPVTLSTDPRNHFNTNVGTASRAGVLSQWPETFGFAALRSPELTRRFADIVRQEYLALGLRVALHPQADVATEYRWARVNSTFGEDADVVSELVVSCIEGLQGQFSTTGDGRESVSTTTKHFPGAGPEKDGEDSHFTYGKEQVYPGDNFEYHSEPFRKAIAAGTRQIMPSYAMPVGTKYEPVGFAFNKGVITGILRNELGFDGIILSDWGLITDAVIRGQEMPARAWGCEHLSELERAVKILDAGCDQFGGDSRPELVVQAVQEGLVSEARIDKSVRRVLAEKFRLGLFDEKRFVDVEKAGEIVGKPEWVKEGKDAQREAFTILTNHGAVLPLSSELGDKKFYVEGLDVDVAAERGLNLVATPAEADVALLRLKTPHQARPGGFESQFHSGSLEFPEKEAARIADIIKTVPTSIVDVYLDRPGVLTPFVEAQEAVVSDDTKGRGTALIANYGSSTDVFLDVCFGTGGSLPRGKLPFDLPRSMKAASNSREDVPFDTKDPLFRFGHGLEYPQ